MSVHALERTTEEKLHDMEGIVYAMQIDQKYKPHDEKYKRVTYDQYAEAVINLFNLAEMGCGGSSCAAQVLLSLYNGTAFNVDMARVACNLDAKNLDAALVAIKGRGQLMIEPHNVIQDGSKHFKRLWQQWENLHVRKRYADYYREH